MITHIRDIGTSKGIIIPATLLKEYDLKGEVRLEPTEKGIMLIPSGSKRTGWEEAAKKLAESNEKNAMPDVFEDEDLEDWEWKE